MVGACLAAACCAARPALADPDETQLHSARELFASAERDEDAGRWAEALEKLQRVSQVRLTAGVRYHIALCEEHLGHLAGALGAYAAAAQQARAESAEDVLRLVGKQLSALDSRVPRITVRLVPPRADARVTLDDALVGTEAVATPIPVDPGRHHAEVTVPDGPPVAADADLHEGESVVLDLKVAAPSPAPAAAAAAPATPSSGPSDFAADRGDRTARDGNRTGAIATTAVAVALAGAGVGAFLMAGSQHANGVKACGGDPDPSPDACDSQKNAVRTWDYAAAISWLGAGAVGTVAVVLWLKPARDGAPRGARLTVGPGTFALGTSF
jgi:hypothetical protein